MCISHKWSHIETIHPAQSQSHILTSSHINYRVAIYPALLAHLTIHLFTCDHYLNYPPGSVLDFIISGAICRTQPYYLTYSSPTFNQFSFSYTSHFNSHISLHIISIIIQHFHNLCVYSYHILITCSIHS